MPPGGAPQPLRVLIASADALVARRLLAALVCDERVDVVGAASSCSELAALVGALTPDVTLLDQQLMPETPYALLEGLAAAASTRGILLVDGPVELDWEAPGAGRIIAFVGRDRPADEIAEVVVEVTALALALASAELEPTLG